MDSRVKTIVLDRDNLPTLDQMDATAIPENRFEATALRLLKSLHPTCYVFPFKPIINYSGTGWKPDLAVVEKKMGYWFVIEVEIATHSLQRHIMPQVTAFRFGDYGDETAQALSENLNNVSFQQAQTLIRHIPRYIAVVSNSDNVEWESALAAENIQFVSIAGFEDVQGQTAHLVTGTLKPAERSLCFGTVFATFQAIRVPQAPFWSEQSYRVTDSTGTANWECTLQGGYAWLAKRRGVLSFDDRTPIQILFRDDDSLFLRSLI